MIYLATYSPSSVLESDLDNYNSRLISFFADLIAGIELVIIDSFIHLSV